MKNKKVKFIVDAAVIAALYVVLTYLAAAFKLSSGVIQVRFSEALTILPVFTPAAIPGLFVGCILANALTGAVVIDVICGSIATLIGAVGAWLIGKYVMNRLKYAYFLAPLPTIIANAAIVPFVLRYAYGMQDAMWYMVLTVGLGEIISAGMFGVVLYLAIRSRASRLFCFSDAFFFFRRLRTEVLIVLAFEFSVIQFSALVRLFTEIFLKIRVGRNDIKRPSVEF